MTQFTVGAQESCLEQFLHTSWAAAAPVPASGDRMCQDNHAGTQGIAHVSEKDIQGEGMKNEVGRGAAFSQGRAILFYFFSFIPSPTFIFVFSFLLDLSS